MEKLKGQNHMLRGVLISVLLFLFILLVLGLGLSQLNQRSDQEQAAALAEAVRRATVLCYAVEGRYPSDVQELCEHYGLTFDHDRYMVTMDSFASNLLPDIHVLTIGGEAYE
ncbi:MAG: hypothetical protein RSD76_06745 [Clostridia bacterium]